MAKVTSQEQRLTSQLPVKIKAPRKTGTDSTAAVEADNCLGDRLLVENMVYIGAALQVWNNM